MTSIIDPPGRNDRMKVVVSGASGFVGMVVVRTLLERGLEVRSLSRDPSTVSGDAVRQPDADASDETFRSVFSGATHFVHCAALNNNARNASQANFMHANATLTERFAAAAAAVLPGRFILISSLRAVVGPGYAGTVDEVTVPQPVDFYGKSKRQAEILSLETYRSAGRVGDLVIFRPAAIYGVGAKGGLAPLLRLSDTPLPLPFGRIVGQRSYVSVEAVAGAVTLAIAKPSFGRNHYLLADRHPVTLPEAVAAFRRGLERPTRLFCLPSPLLAAVARAGRASPAWHGFSASQIVDASAFIDEGWQVEDDTPARLAALARSLRG